MKKQISLNSKEWCDIVFKDKNKSYGAYQMRMTSSKRHIVAFGCVVLIVLFVSIFPMVMNKVKAANTENFGNIDNIYEMETIVEVKEQEEIFEVAIPEPPKIIYAQTIAFTPPVIAEDNLVSEDVETHSVDEIKESGAIIGAIDNPDGVLDLTAEIKRAEENIIIEAPTNGRGKIHDIVELMPQFPGGTTDMYKYISDNLKYPVVDQEQGIQGRVTVRFVVDNTGKIDNVEILKGVSPSCDREAIRVISSMPKWIPGKQNGQAVNVYFTLPIVYRLK